MIFVVSSNYFAILAPQVTGYVFDLLKNYKTSGITTAQHADYDWLVRLIIGRIGNSYQSYETVVALACTTILAFALISGLFLFLMRQTIIVMSRHIEYDQKNEIFNHYQKLNVSFFKKNTTGDLMNRISEDVGKVRMYSGPAIMYLANTIVTTITVLIFMLSVNRQLTLIVFLPLPFLSYLIYRVSDMINKQSGKVQQELGNLT